MVVVTIPVSCDQTGDTQVHVTFVVGDQKRPAGLLAATEQRPRGPAVIVDAWGDNLVAYAWHVVIEVMTNVAGAAGRDLDGSRLVAVGVAVSGDEVRVTPMARMATSESNPRTPPAALTCTCGGEQRRISRKSSSRAPVEP